MNYALREFQRGLLLASLAIGTPLCFGQRMVWKSPSPSPTQATELLQAICPGTAQPRGSSKGSLPRCTTCPAFTTSWKAHFERGLRGPLGNFGLVSVIRGSFTAPGAHEALADFKGCEPHSEEFGGSVLLTRREGSWTLVNYVPALITSNCLTYPLKTGRDILLCEGEDRHMDASWQGVLVTSFSKVGTSRSQTIFSTADTRVACGRSAVWGSISQIALHDLNGDGMPDLTMGVRIGEVRFSKPGGACGAASPGHTTERSYKLKFLFQCHSDTFAPAASDKALVARLKSLFHRAFQKAQSQALSGP